MIKYCYQCDTGGHFCIDCGSVIGHTDRCADCSDKAGGTK